MAAIGDEWPLSCPATAGGPARAAKWYGAPILAGTYAKGLVSLLGDAFDDACLESWPDGFRRGLEPIAATGFGDLFLVEQTSGATMFLDVQRQKLLAAAPQVRLLLDVLLPRPKVREVFLKEPLLGVLVDQWGPLEHGHCFILTPWQMLGGMEASEAFEPGHLDVYLSLVGQTAFEQASG